MFNYALIMAAGRGVRMMPLTNYVPKPMIQVNGITLISRAISQLKKQISCIGINVGYKGPELARHVLEEGVSMVFNTTDHGNGWWVFNTVMKHINEPVLVLTCDNIVELDLTFIERNYALLNFPSCMVVPVKPVHGIEGDFIFGSNGFVEALSRERASDYYCSGIQVINPAVINTIIDKEDDFYGIWSSLISLRQLRFSEVYPNNWYTVNTLEQLNGIPDADLV